LDQPLEAINPKLFVYPAIYQLSLVFPRIADNRYSIYFTDNPIMADFFPAVTCYLSFFGSLELAGTLSGRLAKSPGTPREQFACPSPTEAAPAARCHLSTTSLLKPTT